MASTYPLIRGFKGLNNRVDPTMLGPEWQLAADNVLSDAAGYLARRPGYAEFLTSIADVFGTRDGRLFVVTTAGSLYEVYADGSYRQRATGFIGGPFQWGELGAAVFAMSETAAWSIYPDRVVAWGIEALDAPALGVAGGALPAGEWRVATALEAPDGRMGGCVGIASLTLQGPGGLTVYSPPVAGHVTRLYLGPPRDSALYYAGTFPVDGLATVSSLPPLGTRLETWHVYPPPLGGRVGVQGNRMVVGVWEPQHDRSVLYWSRPDAPHWFDLETDYQIVAGQITLLADVAGGLLVGTDRSLTFVAAGAPAQLLANFGAWQDTLSMLDSGQIAFWTDRGLALYPPLTLPSDAALIPDQRRFSTGAVLHHAGSSYIVASLRGETSSRAMRPPYAPLPVTLSG